MAHRPLTRVIEGLPWSHYFSEETVRSALAYQAQPDDVFVVSYPKCGTTWLQYLVYNIYSGGVPARNREQFWDNTPFLEMRGAERSAQRTRPGAIKTHLPFSKQPYSPEARYLYITRNPFDCCVSYFYHTKHLPAYCFSEGTFDEFFDLFVAGKLEFGDYFDHLLSWYTHRADPNVLFLTYEELKKDTKAAVTKIASFLGDEYAQRLCKEPELVDRILEAANLSNMKKIFNSCDFAAKDEATLQPVLEPCQEQGDVPPRYERTLAEARLAQTLATDFAREKTPKYGLSEAQMCATPATQGSLNGDDTIRDLLMRPMTGEFVRKGAVGDWKGHFSADQVQRMLERIRTKTAGSDVMDLWKDVDIPR